MPVPFGYKQSPESSRKKSIAMKGRKFTTTHRKRISDALKGIARTDEHRKKISESKRGKSYWSDETRRKMQEYFSGSNNPQWKGGRSFEPYCEKFTEEFKNRVRFFFNNTCVLCGQKSTKRKHDVHHVNYNKNTCCDNETPLFVLLCHRCHLSIRADETEYQKRFTNLINESYGGKCYFTREEFRVK